MLRDKQLGCELSLRYHRCQGETVRTAVAQSAGKERADRWTDVVRKRLSRCTTHHSTKALILIYSCTARHEAQ